MNIAARSRVADRPEEEYAGPPPVRPGFPSRTGPGRAEIKPHTVAGIRNGLTQLAHHPAGERVLITYIYVSPATLRVFVLVPHARILRWRRPPVSVGGRLTNGIPDVPARTGNDLAWLGSLGDWYRLPAEVPTPVWTMRQWLDRVGPTVFGSMVEPVVRSEFLRAYRGTMPAGWSKFPHAAGADVAWQELAEYLHELAGELAAGRA